jgi:chloramphenicol-sensitive protein RarD
LIKRSYLRKYFSEPATLAKLTVTGILVSFNWGIYIYAVNSGQMIEASLGYFINPLVRIMLGMIFLGEKLNKTQFVALLFAIAGVAYLTINYGHFPWIAIGLALSFGLYGLLKKKMDYDSMSALAVETTLVVPIALGYLIFGMPDGVSSFVAADLSVVSLLVLAGVVTALPLYWFGMAAVRIPLYSIGFFQYISPTINLIIGIYLFRESFSSTHALAFSLIWVGLVLYISDIVIRLRK